MADPLRRDLVDRDARVDIGARGLLGPDAGQEGRAGPRMVARPVLPAGGVDLVQSGDDLDLALDPLQRLHGLVQVEVLPLLLGPPFRQVDPVGDVDERHADRGAGGAGCRQGGGPGRGGGAGPSREQGIKGGEGHRNPHPLEELATAQAGVPLGEGRFVVRMVGFHGLVRVG